ncbi:MAG: hypothetical protein ACSLEN_08110 [Candidatus Malihini olakiniferum]
MATINSEGFPTLWQTVQSAAVLFADPCYITGSDDQGISCNVLAFLKRVAIRFGLVALVVISAGFMIGRFRFLASVCCYFSVLNTPSVGPFLSIRFG